MDFFSQTPKWFRLQAILHYSTGSVKLTTKKGPGFCYVAPSLPVRAFLVK